MTGGRAYTRLAAFLICGGVTVDKRLNRLPVTFEKTGEVAGKDVRFINVTIDVMHTGDNLNGSTFSKEVVEQALDSIKNTPILGYIEQNKDGDLDFKGHEHELQVDEDGIKYVYAGSAYGVIPESCNARWVTRDDGTGTEREYLRVDGLLWTKFDDSCDIFTRDGVKAQSMELTEMDGRVDKRGYYIVDKFAFDGCCVLSTTDPRIKPAMTGSEVVANFSAGTIAGQIKDMLAEYTALQGSQSSKEAEIDNFAKGEDVLEKKNEILASYGIDASKLDFSLEDITIEELEEKCKAMTAEPAQEPEAEPAAEITAEVPEQEPAQEPAAQMSAEPESVEPAAEPKEFSLTVNQQMDELRGAIAQVTFVDRWGDEGVRYWMQDVQDNRAIVCDMQDWKTYAIPFSMDGDNVVVDWDGKKRVKVQYVDWEDGAAESELPVLYEELAGRIDAAKKAISDYAEVKAQLNEIQPKYDAYVAAEAAAKQAADEAKRAQLFELMDKKLEGVAEYAALRENKDMEFSALEDECYKLLGKKAAEFSYMPPKNAKGEVNNARFGVDGVQMQPAEGKYGDLFERYHVR